ncbi:MAG: hypothetical protein Q8M07_20460 [Prosthecobacter sp.]|nr:hypothetical protein [Prosthecobacter sp.]
MSSHEPCGSTAVIPLEAHVQELRGRAEATARLQGGATSYWQEVRLFREYASERGLGCLPDQIPELSRAPDDEGNEHQVSLILMDDGLLAPIDLRVQPLNGALLDYVIKACRKP